MLRTNHCRHTVVKAVVVALSYLHIFVLKGGASGLGKPHPSSEPLDEEDPKDTGAAIHNRVT